MDQVPIPEPIMRFEVPFADLLGNAAPGCEPWRSYGQHELWIGRYPAAAPRLCVQELRPEGLLEYDKPDFLLHHIAAGTPYRVAHLMGYWHIADEDILWFQIPRQELTYYIALAGGSTGLPGDHSIAWYCGECAAVIYREEFHGAGDLGEFVRRGARAAVERFNAEAARRRCASCGWEHPPGFPFAPLGSAEAPTEGPGPW